MTALLAVLALAAGPLWFSGIARRVAARARTAGVHGTHQEQVAALQELTTPTEGWSACAAALLTAAGVLTLAAMAVWG